MFLKWNLSSLIVHSVSTAQSSNLCFSHCCIFNKPRKVWYEISLFHSLSFSFTHTHTHTHTHRWNGDKPTVIIALQRNKTTNNRSAQQTENTQCSHSDTCTNTEAYVHVHKKPYAVLSPLSFFSQAPAPSFSCFQKCCRRLWPPGAKTPQLVCFHAFHLFCLVDLSWVAQSWNQAQIFQNAPCSSMSLFENRQ